MPFSKSSSLFTSAVLCMLFCCTVSSVSQPSFEIVQSYEAEEAFQAVAVDSAFFYAIASRSIGKYNRRTGERVDRWEEEKNGPVLHLDSGVIVDGKLYAAHSNYPDLPMTSSVEIWDAETLTHEGSHSFGIRWGSCTWIDRHDGQWWAVFAHYDEFKDEIGKDNRWTTLVRFNDRWDPEQSWTLPNEVIERFDGKSNSGGSWGEDGLLYLSGHDRPELYVVELPEAGSVLKLVTTIPASNEGQGIAWDRSSGNLLFGIKRSERRVVVLKD